MVQSFQITQTDEGLRIEGFPDAIKVAGLSGVMANQLSHMALHRNDLMFALSCLDEINTHPNTDTQYIVRNALWRSAVVYYIKCFMGAAKRSQLSPKKLYKDRKARDVYSYFYSLRCKHICHDENAYNQVAPCAVVNPVNSPKKIAKVLTPTIYKETLDQDHFEALYRLITEAVAWVDIDFDRLCATLAAELEAMPYDSLLLLDSASVTSARTTDVGATRTGP